MVFKFALVVMVVFLNSATDGKYLLVKLGAKLANKGFEAEPDNRQDNRCQPKHCKYILSSSFICGDYYRYKKSYIFLNIYLKSLSVSDPCNEGECCSGLVCRYDGDNYWRCKGIMSEIHF